MQGLICTGNTYQNFSNLNARVSSRTAGATYISEWYESLRALRLSGESNVVLGGRFNGRVRLEVHDGNTTQAIIDANADPPTPPFPRANATLIRGVVMDTNPGIDIVAGFGNFSGDHLFDATSITIEASTDGAGNPLGSGNGITLTSWQSGTSLTSTPSGPFTPAFKLTTEDVGPASYDPYHDDNGPNW
jgi:hypothetical protein